MSSNSYGETKYWDDRYSREGSLVSFDWYQKYVALAGLFDVYLKKDGRVLMVGCGNSALSEDMSADGYKDVFNIDISPVVINAMKEKNAGNKSLSFEVMDVRRLEADEASFDFVVDKGTLDSLMCGDSSIENAHKMLSEIARVLKPGGLFILITYGDPRSRMHHLEHPSLPWSVCLHVIPRPGADLTLEDGSNFDSESELVLQPASVGEDNKLKPFGISLDSGNVHYVYVCTKAAVDAGNQTEVHEDLGRPDSEKVPIHGALGRLSLHGDEK